MKKKPKKKITKKKTAKKTTIRLRSLRYDNRKVVLMCVASPGEVHGAAPKGYTLDHVEYLTTQGRKLWLLVTYWPDR